MANWFIGAVPADTAWYGALPSPPEGFRSFAAADLHMTVAFLADCGEERARAAWAAVAGRWPDGAIDATLGAVVPLGPPGRYSALSAELEDGREPASRLLSSLRDVAAEAAGSRKERRDPLPHVTVARPPRGASEAQREAGLAWAGGLGLHGTAVRFEELALFTWSDDRRVSMFRVVERRPL